MHAKSSGIPGEVDRLTGLLRRFEIVVSVLDIADPLSAPRGYGEEAEPPHGHLHVLSRGAIDLEMGAARQRRRVAGPNLVLCPTPAPHRVVPIERPAVTCAALRFSGGPVHPLLRALPPVLVVSASLTPSVAPTVALLEAEVEHVRCGRPLVAGRLLEVVLLQLLRWAFDHPDDAGITRGLVRGMADPGLAASLVAVHEDPGANWTLERMARVAALSRSSYAERFRSLVDETPAAYLARYRIALAQQRLLRGDQVAAIAPAVGYANGSGLSRAFAAHTGLSPSAWLAAATAGPPDRPSAAPPGR
ncbi:MAG: helix-turn-helix transcriptional regulator [Actinobacteria bacterium]|nr:helix-turn-helix transcriptional regulator [Actinomycetota bacterium]